MPLPGDEKNWSMVSKYLFMRMNSINLCSLQLFKQTVPIRRLDCSHPPPVCHMKARNFDKCFSTDTTSGLPSIIPFVLTSKQELLISPSRQNFRCSLLKEVVVKFLNPLLFASWSQAYLECVLLFFRPIQQKNF